MNLDKVVEDDQEGSARRRFSKGQGKRMAMIFSLLERKPIIVLDEWAADQDPHFRKYFYEVLIPRLKEQGKTIIAVTHDDAYFQYADRIVKFDYGHIVRDIKTNSSEPVLEDFWS
jgi:ABC-type siderophore export system fused ATPase/permease subunit